MFKLHELETPQVRLTIHHNRPLPRTRDCPWDRVREGLVRGGHPIPLFGWKQWGGDAVLEGALVVGQEESQALVDEGQSVVQRHQVVERAVPLALVPRGLLQVPFASCTGAWAASAEVNAHDDEVATSAMFLFPPAAALATSKLRIT